MQHFFEKLNNLKNFGGIRQNLTVPLQGKGVSLPKYSYPYLQVIYGWDPTKVKLGSGNLKFHIIKWNHCDMRR